MKDREIDSFIENPLQPKGLITDCTNAYLILNMKRMKNLIEKKQKILYTFKIYERKEKNTIYRYIILYVIHDERNIRIIHVIHDKATRK